MNWSNEDDGHFWVRIGAIPNLEFAQKVMHCLVAPRLPQGDTATMTAVEFSMDGGLLGWTSMSGYYSL